MFVRSSFCHEVVASWQRWLTLAIHITQGLAPCVDRVFMFSHVSSYVIRIRILNISTQYKKFIICFCIFLFLDVTFVFIVVAENVLINVFQSRDLICPMIWPISLLPQTIAAVTCMWSKEINLSDIKETGWIRAETGFLVKNSHWRKRFEQRKVRGKLPGC